MDDDLMSQKTNTKNMKEFSIWPF